MVIHHDIPHETPRVPHLPIQQAVSRQSSLPQWRALRSQSTASSTILTTGVVVLPDWAEDPDSREPTVGAEPIHVRRRSVSRYNSLGSSASQQLPITAVEQGQLSAIREQEVEPEAGLGFEGESVQDWGCAPAEGQPARWLSSPMFSS